jgi:nitrate reductase delta subunit
LPDHLPVLLEYLALQPFVDAQAILADAAHILSVLSSRLSRRGSDYAAVFDALLHLADCQPDGDALAALQAQSEDDPEDLAALDAVWAESQVTFGPDIGPNKLHTDCPQAEEMLARMKVPQNHL